MDETTRGIVERSKREARPVYGVGGEFMRRMLAAKSPEERAQIQAEAAEAFAEVG